MNAQTINRALLSISKGRYVEVDILAQLEKEGLVKRLHLSHRAYLTDQGKKLLEFFNGLDSC